MEARAAVEALASGVEPEVGGAEALEGEAVVER